MVQSSNLDDTQIILLATQFVTESDFTQLQLLASEQNHILTSSLLYRQLLTYLPTDADNINGLVSFLTNLENGFQNVSDLDERLEKSEIEDLTAKESRRKLHELRLGVNEPLRDSEHDDDLGAFIVQWLRKVENVAGIPASMVQMLKPFVASRPKLLLWQDSYLIPLIKLRDDFYPGRAEFLNTHTLETLRGVHGVKSLLQFAEQDGEKAQIGRDLEQVVTPWVQGASKAKRRRLSQSTVTTSSTSWHDVNEWIYSTSHSNFDLAAKSFLDWNGPADESHTASDTASLRETELLASYLQTGIALVATSRGNGEDRNIILRRLLDRAASMSPAVIGVKTSTSQQSLSDASRSDLLENSILRSTNPITYPSEEVFSFLENCLSAQKLLEHFKISLSVVTLVDVSLFASEERQKQELDRILQQVPRLTRTEISWPLVRQHLYTLQSGQNPSIAATVPEKANYHFLGRISSNHLESEFVDVLIANGQYTTANNIYLDTSNPPLGRDTVQEHIVGAIYAAYDNASNGNRTRGGMKRAHDILKAFQPKFASTTVFNRIDHLIQATHSLSFYQLTLQHGVPFQPATIRAHRDPLSLIEKVLAQNHKAFTKLDDLIGIGRNLVQADLPVSTDSSESSKSLEERLFDAQHRITYLAITSALSDHDFDTAYSYITTRLATSPSQTSGSPFTDDISWRAAYAAGKYRPSSSPKDLHGRITGLSKRMDLLSLALTLTPTPDSLSEILATWRRCEEELDNLKSQAIEEERAVDIRSLGDSALPGGFAEDRDFDAAETRRLMERRAVGGSGPSYEEEAPMGLFDVARGAASAFRKSAFPLRGAGGQVKIRDQMDMDDSSGRESFDGERPGSAQQRVRKRDMVSNMVTGGLVSGMSWVLGAPSTKPDEQN